MAEAPTAAEAAGCGVSSALVAGANRGLGLEIVKQLLAAGVTVTATARKLDDAEYMKNLQALKESAGDKLIFESLDLGNMESVAALSTKLAANTYDQVWVNGGTGGRHTDKGWGKFGDLDATDLVRTFETNCVGALMLIQGLYECVKRSSSELKCICGITSHFGSVSTLGETVSKDVVGFAYRISKTSFTMGLALLYESQAKADSVRVLIMTPNHVKTDMGGHDWAPHTVQDSVKGLVGYAMDKKFDYDPKGYYDGIKGADYRWPF